MGDALTFRTISKGTTLVLFIENYECVQSHDIYVPKWALSIDDLPKVQSSVFDATINVLRVVLAPGTIARHTRTWNENMWNPSLRPDEVVIEIEGRDLIEPRLVPLAECIAREVVATALLRKGTCQAEIRLSSEEDCAFVVASTGLAIFGYRTLSPHTWSSRLPDYVRSTLKTYFHVKTGEHRTKVSHDTIAQYLASIANGEYTGPEIVKRHLSPNPDVGEEEEPPKKQKQQ